MRFLCLCKQRLKRFLMQRLHCIPAPSGGNPEPRDVLAAWYLKGDGIEIGPLHRPLPLPKDVNVQYVDRLNLHGLRTHYKELGDANIIEPDIIDDGERLEHFADESLDFIVANHFLEHCEDPVGTLEVFYRRLRPGGVLFMATPDKRRTFDSNRPVTPLKHLIKDHEAGPEVSRRKHYEEWVSVIHGVTDKQELKETVDRLMEENLSIHFHVWTFREMWELMDHVSQTGNLNWEILAAVQHNEEGIFIVARGER